LEHACQPRDRRFTFAFAFAFRSIISYSSAHACWALLIMHPAMMRHGEGEIKVRSRSMLTEIWQHPTLSFFRCFLLFPDTLLTPFLSVRRTPPGRPFIAFHCKLHCDIYMHAKHQLASIQELTQQVGWVVSDLRWMGGRDGPLHEVRSLRGVVDVSCVKSHASQHPNKRLASLGLCDG
jgi:hypothetical protein